MVGVPFAIGSIIGASQSNRLSQRLGRTVLVVGTAMVAVVARRALAAALIRAGGAGGAVPVPASRWAHGQEV